MNIIPIIARIIPAIIASVFATGGSLPLKAYRTMPIAINKIPTTMSVIDTDRCPSAIIANGFNILNSLKNRIKELG